MSIYNDMCPHCGAEIENLHEYFVNEFFRHDSLHVLEICPHCDGEIRIICEPNPTFWIIKTDLQGNCNDR